MAGKDTLTDTSPRHRLKSGLAGFGFRQGGLLHASQKKLLTFQSVP